MTQLYKCDMFILHGVLIPSWVLRMMVRFIRN